MTTIYFMRHGQSIGNVKTTGDAQYAEIGDFNIDLTQKGWSQTFDAGRFMKAHLEEQGYGGVWPLLIHSPYLRVEQSAASLIAGMHGFAEGEPERWVDVCLAEKFFGSMSYFHVLEQSKKKDDEAAKQLASLLNVFSKAVFNKNTLVSRPLFGDSYKDTFESSRLFMLTTLKKALEQGRDPIVIPAHGAVIKTCLMEMLGVHPGFERAIKVPDNADIIMVKNYPKKPEAYKIYSGPTGKAVPDPGHWYEAFRQKDLPPVPDFIKARTQKDTISVVKPQGPGPKHVL